VHYIGAVTIAIIGWLNYRGVRWGTLFQNSMTIIKCGGLLGLTLLALALGSRSSSLPEVSQAAPGVVGIVPYALALISVLWVYNGWAEVSFVAGEVTDAARNVPRVLIFGTLFVIALYVLANVAYFRVLSIEELRHSPLVAADVANQLVGRIGAVAIGFVVMFSTLGTLNGQLLTGPRALWAMAHDGLLFKRLASVHSRYETPDVAIVVAAGLGIVFASVSTFERLAATVITAILPFYILAVAAVFPLRRRPGYKPAFRTIGYPVTPILFIAASLYLLIAAFIDPAARLPTAMVFLVILTGIPIYWIVAKRHPAATQE
jgi:amino acid transporter